MTKHKTASLPPHVDGDQFGKLKFELRKLNLFQNYNGNAHEHGPIPINRRSNRGECNTTDDCDHQIMTFWKVENGTRGNNSQVLACRIQFWGENSFVDLIDLTMSCSTYTCSIKNVNESNILIDSVEYKLFGSISGLKHYFKDMNNLTLLILDKSKNNMENIKVLGYGNLNLVSMLHELMISLKSRQIQTSSGRKDEDCIQNDNNVTTSSSCIIKVPISLLSMTEDSFGQCDQRSVIGSLEMKIELHVYIYRQKSAQSLQSITENFVQERNSKTSLEKETAFDNEREFEKMIITEADLDVKCEEMKLHNINLCDKANVQKTKLSRSQQATEINAKMNSVLFTEFGVDTETLVSSGTTGIDDYDSIMCCAMLPSIGCSDKQRIKLFPKSNLPRGDFSLNNYSNVALGSDFYDSQSCDQLMQTLLREENRLKSPITCKKPLDINSTSSTIRTKALSMKFVEISIHDISFTVSASDIVNTLRMQNRSNRYVVVYLRYHISNSILPSTHSSNQVTLRVCSCSSPKRGILDKTNRTKLSMNGKAKQNVHKFIMLPKNHCLSHRKKYRISINLDHETHASENTGIKFDVIVQPLCSSGFGRSQSITLSSLNKDNVVASGFVSLSSLLHAKNFSLHEKIPLLMQGKDEVANEVFAHINAAIELSSDHTSRHCKIFTKSEGGYVYKSQCELETSLGSNLQSTEFYLTTKINSDSTIAISNRPFWMKVELKEFHIQGIMFDGLPSSAQLRIKASCSLAIASLEDLKPGNTSQSIKSAFKEETFPISCKVQNGERVVNVNNVNALLFNWMTPLKIDMNNIDRSSFGGYPNEELILESWIEYCDAAGKNLDQFIGVAKVPFSTTDDTLKISSASNSFCGIFKNGPIKLEGGKHKSCYISASTIVAIGCMSSVVNLPKLMLAVKVVEEWWLNVKISVSRRQDIVERKRKMISEEAKFVSDEQIIQTMWWKWRSLGSKRILSKTEVSKVDEKHSVAIDTTTKHDNKVLMTKTDCVNIITFNGQRSQSTQEVTEASNMLEAHLVPLKCEDVGLASNLEENECKIFIKLGPVLGVHEILTMWLHSSNEPDINLDNDHELIASGVIITFQILAKKSGLNDSKIFCTSEILPINQIKRKSIDFQTSVMIDQSEEVINSMTRDSFQCILWFIPLVSDCMNKKYPSTNFDALHLPVGSRKVCHTSCPLKAFHSLSMTTTYKCPWIVSLTEDCEDIEMMGAIYMVFSRDSPIVYSEPVIDLCQTYFARNKPSECNFGDLLLQKEFTQNRPSLELDQLSTFVCDSTQNGATDKAMNSELKENELTFNNSLQTNSNAEDLVVSTSKDVLESYSLDEIDGYQSEVFSQRNLSSVLASLDIITADATRSLVDNSASQTNAALLTSSQIVGSSPYDINLKIIENPQDDLPQIELLDTFCNVEINSSDKMNLPDLVNEERVSSISSNAEVTHKKSFSTVMKLLNDVTSEMQKNGIQYLSEDTMSREKKYKYSSNNGADFKEDKEAMVHDELKNEEYKSSQLSCEQDTITHFSIIESQRKCDTLHDHDTKQSFKMSESSVAMNETIKSFYDSNSIISSSTISVPMRIQKMSNLTKQIKRAKDKVCISGDDFSSSDSTLSFIDISRVNSFASTSSSSISSSDDVDDEKVRVCVENEPLIHTRSALIAKIMGVYDQCSGSEDEE